MTSTETHPFIYILSMAASLLQWQNYEALDIHGPLTADPWLRGHTLQLGALLGKRRPCPHGSMEDRSLRGDYPICCLTLPFRKIGSILERPLQQGHFVGHCDMSDLYKAITRNQFN